MFKEEYRNIFEYEDLYQISNFGNLKRIADGSNTTFIGKILKAHSTNKYGHLNVSLYRNGKRKRFYIHRLVLEAFVGPCPIGMECCHLDGNPQNNRLDNLKWDTHINNEKDKINHNTLYNGTKHWCSKLMDEKVIEIIRLLKEDKLTQREIAKQFNISFQTVSLIKLNKIWKHIKRN